MEAVEVADKSSIVAVQQKKSTDPARMDPITAFSYQLGPDILVHPVTQAMNSKGVTPVKMVSLISFVYYIYFHTCAFASMVSNVLS